MEPVLRKDAARTRAAILAAARELLQSGRDVPMYEIGRHAGIGQATLYRHFPDRAAIVATIAHEYVDRIETVAASRQTDSHAIIDVLREAVQMLVCIHDILGILRNDATLAPVLAELRQRVRTVFDTTLNRSPRDPLLRADLGTDDLLLVLTMINGALSGIPTAAERDRVAARALDIAVSGMLDDRRRDRAD